MISYLPASLIARMQYRLDWIEVRFVINTGLDDHKVRQFYRLRFVHRADAIFYTDLLKLYDANLILAVGDWRIVLAGELQDT